MPGGPPGTSWPPGPGRAPIPFGLIDLPGLQRQQTAVIDLDTFGHLMAVGAPRSGRSQLLRTLATADTAGHTCADLHLYGLDCGNGRCSRSPITRILAEGASAGIHLVVAGDPSPGPPRRRPHRRPPAPRQHRPPGPAAPCSAPAMAP